MLEGVKDKIRRRFFGDVIMSFSQAGEDRIMSLLAKIIGLSDIYYLDVGASNPMSLNNTYFFYLQGSRGVCVEADSVRYEELIRARPHDKCLNIGVCGLPPENSTMPFYVMPSQSLSSFSKEHVMATGQEVSNTIEVRMIQIGDLVQNHCERIPNLISIDVEGMDDEIIRNIDFGSIRPEILCVETTSYGGAAQYKNHDLIQYITDNGYVVFADTFINTIFVDSDSWNAVRASESTTIYPTQYRSTGDKL